MDTLYNLMQYAMVMEINITIVLLLLCARFLAANFATTPFTHEEQVLHFTCYHCRNARTAFEAVIALESEELVDPYGWQLPESRFEYKQDYERVSTFYVLA
ncbi:hypothetical protein Trydic_g7953 [Trypoxylus dichotomus]